MTVIVKERRAASNGSGKPPDLATMLAPPGPVVQADDCPGFGRVLPSGWVCPTCPLNVACYQALEAKDEHQEPVEKAHNHAE